LGNTSSSISGDTVGIMLKKQNKALASEELAVPQSE
jgi:hypothetical protein